MDTGKRILKKPVLTAVWLGVIMLASSIVGVAASLWASAQGVPAALEKEQITIALQNAGMEEIGNGSFSFNPEAALLYEEDIEYLRSLPQVKNVDLRYFSGAYIPALNARIGLNDFFGNYNNEGKGNDSYRNVLVLGTVEATWETPFESIAVNDLSAFGHGERVSEKYCCALLNVEDVLSMHHDYPLFPKIADPKKVKDELYTGKVRVRFPVFDETEGPFFKVGSRYVIYGEYDPCVSSFGNDPMPDQGVPMAPHILYYNAAGGLFGCFAEGDSLVCYRSEYELSMMDVPALASAPEDAPAVNKTELPPVLTEDPAIDMSVATKLLTRENRTPIAAEWNGTAEELLSDPYWGELIRKNEMCLHSFPVLGTSCLESMYGFVTGKSKIVEDRTFTAEEYKSGAKALILNESVAHAAGLSVEDTLTVRQFRAAVGSEQGNNSVFSSYLEMERSGENNPGLGRIPFYNETPRDAETFTVVGLYRQENEWEDSLCSFTPNTVFMPRGAQIEDALGGPSVLLGYEEKTHTGYIMDANGNIVESGTFTSEEPIIDPGMTNGLYMSIILKNGSINSFTEQIAADSAYTEHEYVPGQIMRTYTKGLGEHTFLCFDQGYDKAKEAIGAIIASARKLALFALAGAALIFAAYMLLYQGLERKTVGVMRSLGARKATVRRYLFFSGLILAALGIVLGTALSGVASGLVSGKLAELTVSQAHLTGSDEFYLHALTEGGIPTRELVLVALAEAAASALALYVQAAIFANQKIRKLMGK